MRKLFFLFGKYYRSCKKANKKIISLVGIIISRAVVNGHHI